MMRREALEAQYERIRATCFSHPVRQALSEQIEREVKQVLGRVIEGALEEEMAVARKQDPIAAIGKHHRRRSLFKRGKDIVGHISPIVGKTLETAIDALVKTVK